MSRLNYQPTPTEVIQDLQRRLKHLEAQVIARQTVLRRAGNPEGAVVAPPGTIYLRTDGGATTTLYVKTSGSGATGWTAK